MEKYNVKFKKKFGQNFLKDNSIVERLVNDVNILPNSLVIEVGPGGAILTKQLSNVAKNVLAYEIDYDLKDELKKKLINNQNVDIVFSDFLTRDIVNDVKRYEYNHIYFVSNVPYYITTPIVMKLIDSKIKFDNIVMMVQKEVADRFSSSICSKNYGSITVFLNYYFDIKSLLFVSRQEFIPVPNVDSEIISLKRKEKLLAVKKFDVFEKLVKDSFQFKRKNIKNNLKNYNLEIIDKILSENNLSLSSRAEEISVEIFVKIANAIA